MAVIVPFETPGASIEELVALVAGDMERVNATILSRTGSDVTMIPEVANHLISSGGKRLRPMLTLAMANLAGYTGDGHIKLAASVEFMHTATLLHDDVVDESDMRRGKLAARMLWGNEASVLVGDFLLGQAFRMMVEVGSLRALDILSAAAAIIAEGEVMQLAAAKNTATTEDEYLAVIRGKTAELFAAACEVGPVIANRPKAEQTACRSLGMNLGIAFQLVDDVLDYGGKTRQARQEHRRRFSRGQDHPARRAGLPPRQRHRARLLDHARSSAARSATAISITPSALMNKHRALEDTIEPRPPLRRHGRRRAGAVPVLADEERAGAGGGVLSGAVALGLRAFRFRYQLRHPEARGMRTQRVPWGASKDAWPRCIRAVRPSRLAALAPQGDGDGFVDAAAHHVIASVAKQSRMPARKQSGLLRCARNDGVWRTAVARQLAFQATATTLITATASRPCSPHPYPPHIRTRLPSDLHFASHSPTFPPCSPNSPRSLNARSAAPWRRLASGGAF